MDCCTFSTILLLIVLLSILFLIIKSYLTINRFKDVPGPRPRLPLLGNTWLFFRPEVPLSQLVSVVFSELANKYREDGMLALFYGSKMIVYLLKAEWAAEFLKDNNLVNKAVEYDMLKVWLGNGLLTSSGSHWKMKRRLLNPTFHSKILDDYIPSMNEQCLKLISKLRIGTMEPYIDIRSLMSETTLNIISMTAMGSSLDDDLKEVNEYRECLKRVPTTLGSRLYNPLNWTDFVFYRLHSGQQLSKDLQTMRTFIQKVISKRKVDFKPGIDFSESKQMAFLDLLLTLQFEDNTITDEELQNDVETFMFAGHDTSSTCLMWTLLLLGNYPECRKKVEQEINAIFGDDRQRDVNKDDIHHMQYTECVIKESLRMYPPASVFGRTAISDVVIGGHKFPKGTSIFIPIRELHKDEDSFPNPLDFIPERFENQTKSQIGFVPFAIGPRNCIGQRFAMIEMKIILAQIFRNFSFEALDKETDIKVSMNVVMKPASPIRLSFHCL